ncbi:alcohol-forming fatty acyl-CoA reductase-like [Triticum urartu]|uniref:Fatty acyl-CoA reductase n=2 Tax=Triticum urartu TaxID=4572 RepID=A0A8R7NWY7_TRIUA|nr:alcohol-forming fatty acyl-CoA reductase-like [Triticum urartu]
MESSAVAECLRDKCILITGSTGYLGKLLVEKILRVQPAVKKLYLLVRAPDAMSAEQRVLSEVIGKDPFNLLREKYGITGFQNFIKEKVVPLAGDIMASHLGLDNARVDALSEEIDVILNVAATTSFYERYDVALACNALGARNACQFAKKCLNMKLFLHVSTAYVAGTQDGLLLEKALQSGETLREGLFLDVEAELQLVENVKNDLAIVKKTDSSAPPEKSVMKKLGLERACHFGWPNVYAFTKAIGETLIGQERGDLPVVIIRPTMVTSTYKDPFPGWIEGARTIDALIVAYNEQALPCFIGNRDDIIDVIPADMVVNATLVAMVVHWNDKQQVIYHVSSSLRNPLTVLVMEDACEDYFNDNPRVLENGKPLKNRRPYLFKGLASFRAYMFLVYKVPLEMLHAVSMLFCGLFSKYYNKLNQRYNFLELLVKLYAPYAFFKGRFDDTNFTKLRMELETENGDDDIFNCDPKNISWHKYFLHVHVPAVINDANINKNRSE